MYCLWCFLFLSFLKVWYNNKTRTISKFMCFVKAEPRNKPKIMDHCRSRTAETFDFVTEEVVTNLCALQSLEGGTFDALLDQAEAVRAIWFSEHPQKEPLPQCVAGKILCTNLIAFITCYVYFYFYF